MFPRITTKRLAPVGACSPVALSAQNRWAELRTFVRSLVAGGAATAVDMVVIAFAVGIMRVPPESANVPGLLAGAVVQFVGNRRFVFRATKGSIERQMVCFALSEVVALALNGAFYHVAIVRLDPGAAGAVAVRAVTTNVVFLFFSYPVWRWVFQEPMRRNDRVGQRNAATQDEVGCGRPSREFGKRARDSE